MRSNLLRFFVRWLPVLGILAGAVRAQVHEPAWEGQWQTVTASVWATTHNITITNWFGPTNPVVTNRYFLANIDATNIPTNAISSTFNEIVYRPMVTGGVEVTTQTVVESKARIQTNLVFKRYDIVQLDCYYWMDELTRAAGATNETTRFYLSPYDNLVYYKSLFGTMHSGLRYPVSDVSITNLLAATNLTADTAAAAAWFFGTNSDANIFQAARVGTNFLSFTSRMDLFAATSSYRHIMVCTTYIYAAGSAPITNNTVDCCGQTRTVSGTNGQRIVITCTNTAMDPNTTLANYNYHGLRRVLTNCTAILWRDYTMTNYTYFGSASSNLVAVPPPPSFTSIIASAFNVMSTSTPIFRPDSAYQNIFYSEIRADWDEFDPTNKWSSRTYAMRGTQTYSFVMAPRIEGAMTWYGAAGPINPAGIFPYGSVITQIYDSLGSDLPILKARDRFSTTNGEYELVTTYRTEIWGGANTNVPRMSFTASVTTADWVTPITFTNYNWNPPPEVYSYFGTKGFGVNPPVFVFRYRATTNGGRFPQPP